MLASWSAPSEGTIFGVLECNADPLVAYLQEHEKKTGVKISVTTLVVKALALSLRDAPSMNCHILAGKFIPNKSIDISCLVAVDEGKDLANAKLRDADNRSLNELHADIRSKAEKLRKHQDKDFESSKAIINILPVFAIRIILNLVGFLSSGVGLSIPFLGVRPFPFGSAMVTSVGMLGVQQAFIPFTPFTRVPLLLMVGETTKKAVVVPVNPESAAAVSEGKEISSDQWKVAIQTRLTLTATIDHRFVDGTEAAKVGKKMRYLVENPHLLDSDPVASSTPPTPTSTPSGALQPLTTPTVDTSTQSADKAKTA